MIKKIVIFLVLIILLLLACFLAPNISKDNQTEYLLIPPKATLSTIVDSLEKKASVYSSLTFYICTRLTGYDKKIKTGRYELKPGMNNLYLLNNIIKGREVPIRITFNNVRTKEQLCGRICEQIMLDSTSLYQILSDNELLEKYGFDSENAVSLFLPDTYEVYWTVSSEKLLQKMYDAYQKFWNIERLSLAKKCGLTPLEVITLASIVEEESTLESELPTIAGLYINRLRSHRALQADPTIKFALGDFTIKRIRHKHIEMSKNSPYNTYVKTGLPPGPIRIPSKKCIDAVLNYEHHDYIYMCAKSNNENGHLFAVSYRDHVNNANRYRRKMNKLGVE